MDLLNIQEQERLKNCELVIQTGLETFYQVGQALLEIQESKLYRQEFNTFDEYLQGRWNISKQRGYQLINSANVFDNLKKSTIVDFPTNESQTRYLAQLDSDLQGYVWGNIINTFEAVTGKIVEQEVKKHKQLNEAVKEVKSKPMLYQFETQEELIEKAKSLIPAPVPTVKEVIKHVEIIKDESLKSELEQSKDTISELQKRIVDQASNYSKVQNKLIDYENKISGFDKKIKEIETLKSKLSEYEDVKNAMLQINELEKKKSDLFKHSQKVKDILEVLDSSRKFFNQNVLAIGTIQLDNGIKESLQPQIVELVNIIDSWKFAMSRNLLLESHLIGV